MAIVRQMPELLLRGSLANVTMANLDKDQQAHVAEIVDIVTSHPDMQRHKSRFLKELGDTIAADYSDDRLAAEEEFQIAVWRAVVNLYYHRKYTFKCRACESTVYITKRGKPKTIDRQQVPCPNCGKVRVTEAGDANLEVGSFLSHEDFQESYREFTPEQNSPKCESCIEYIPGEKIYTDPDAILDDPRQLTKFFGEFVWNYFRQTLKENQRVAHKRTPQKIAGPADQVIVEEILSLCSRLNLDYNYCHNTQPENGKYHIRIIGLQTPPEFSAELAILREKAEEYNIKVELSDAYVRVAVNQSAPSIEAFVIKPEHVLVLDNYSNEIDEEDGKSFTLSQISYKTVGLEKMIPEDHVDVIDNRDVMQAIRQALPDGDCKKIFDIWAGSGEIYREFSELYGDNRACVNHIARFLGITTRAVNQHKETIKVHCLANNFLPK